MQKTAYSRHTKDCLGQIPETHVPGPAVLMQIAEQAVAVEGQRPKQNEDDNARGPAQEGHDEEGVAQDEGIVQGSNQVGPHLPRGVWNNMSRDSPRAVSQGCTRRCAAADAVRSSLAWRTATNAGNEAIACMPKVGQRFA